MTLLIVSHLHSPSAPLFEGLNASNPHRDPPRHRRAWRKAAGGVTCVFKGVILLPHTTVFLLPTAAGNILPLHPLLLHQVAPLHPVVGALEKSSNLGHPGPTAVVDGKLVTDSDGESDSQNGKSGDGCSRPTKLQQNGTQTLETGFVFAAFSLPVDAQASSVAGNIFCISQYFLFD